MIALCICGYRALRLRPNTLLETHSDDRLETAARDDQNFLEHQHVHGQLSAVVHQRVTVVFLEFLKTWQLDSEATWWTMLTYQEPLNYLSNDRGEFTPANGYSARPGDSEDVLLTVEVIMPVELRMSQDVGDYGGSSIRNGKHTRSLTDIF